MWDPIKWFVHQGSDETSLPALYKNSPPNLGARSSRDRGQSQFHFSLSLPSLVLLRLLRRCTGFSRGTHSFAPGGDAHGGDKSACVGARGCHHLDAGMHADAQLAAL